MSSYEVKDEDRVYRFRTLRVLSQLPATDYLEWFGQYGHLETSKKGKVPPHDADVSIKTYRIFASCGESKRPSGKEGKASAVNSYQVGVDLRFKTLEEAEIYRQWWGLKKVTESSKGPTIRFVWEKDGVHYGSGGGLLPESDTSTKIDFIGSTKEDLVLTAEEAPSAAKSTPSSEEAVRSYQCWGIYMAPRFKTWTEASIYLTNFYLGETLDDRCVVPVDSEPSSQVVWLEGEGEGKEWYSGSKGLTPSKTASNFRVLHIDVRMLEGEEIRFERPSPHVRSFVVGGARFSTLTEAETYLNVRARFMVARDAGHDSSVAIMRDQLRNPTHTLVWEELGEWYCGADGLVPSEAAVDYQVLTWKDLMSSSKDIHFDRKPLPPFKSYHVKLGGKEYRFKTFREAEIYRECFIGVRGHRSGKTFPSAISSIYEYERVQSEPITRHPEEADSQLIWYEGSELFGSREGLLPTMWEGAHTLTVRPLDYLADTITLKRTEENLEMDEQYPQGEPIDQTPLANDKSLPENDASSAGWLGAFGVLALLGAIGRSKESPNREAPCDALVESSEDDVVSLSTTVERKV